VGTLNPKTFESGEFSSVNDFSANPDINFSTSDILSLQWNESGGLDDPVAVES